jgi:Na+-translocating ferredoxin:NAD+ oxidoreductase subunit G
MDKTNKSASILQITLNLTVASLISGMIIAFVYFITEPFAKEQRIRLKNLSMKELVPSATNFKPINQKDEWYAAENNGSRIAYIVIGETRGFGGSIRVMTAVDMEEKIISYNILSHNETPGLGSQADLPKFKKQFTGKKLKNLEVVTIHEEGKIDAITGATITSAAVTKAVRESIVRLHEYIKE